MVALLKAGEFEWVQVLPAPDAHADWLVCAIWRRIAPDAGRPTPSRVPAAVYACLNVVLDADVRLGPFPGRVLPRSFLSGPLSTPLETWAEPGLRSLSLVLHPWALHAWFDRSPADFADRLVDTARLPRLAQPPRAHALVQAAGQPDALPGALDLLRSGGEAAARAATWPLAETLLACGTVAGAARACTLSARQFERRFAAALGLAPKTWLEIKRLEAALHGVIGSTQPLAG